MWRCVFLLYFFHQFIHAFSLCVRCLSFGTVNIATTESNNRVSAHGERGKKMQERQNKCSQEHNFFSFFFFWSFFPNISHANIIHQYHLIFLVKFVDTIYCFVLSLLFGSGARSYLYRIIMFFIIIMSYKNLKHPPDLWKLKMVIFSICDACLHEYVHARRR